MRKLIATTLLIMSVGAALLDSVHAEPGRVVVFPAAAVGDAIAFDENSETTIGSARNAVTVPEGKQLKLKTPALVPASFVELTKLKPDDLQAVNLANSSIKDNELGALLGQRTLCIVDLSHTSISNEALSLLAQLPALAELNLQDTSVDGSLCALGRVESLNIQRTGINDSSFHDCRFERLRRLSANNSAVTGTCFKREVFPNLQTLNMDSTAFGDSEVKAMSLDKLRELTITDCISMTDAGIAQLSKIPTLESLTIGGSEMTERAVLALTQLPMLHNLTIDNGTLTKNSARYLGRLKSLMDLRIVNGGDEAALPIDQIIAANPKIKRLQIEATAVQTGARSSLVGNSAMQVLSLERSKVDDAWLLSEVAKMPKLEHLNLLSTSIAPETIDALLRSKPDLFIAYGPGTLKHPANYLGFCYQLEQTGQWGHALSAVQAELDRLKRRHSVPWDRVAIYQEHAVRLCKRIGDYKRARSMSEELKTDPHLSRQPNAMAFAQFQLADLAKLTR